MADYISGIVLQGRDNDIFEKKGVYGLLQEIATTSNGGYPSGDFLAVPTTGYGVTTSFTFIPYDINDSAAAYIVAKENAGAIPCVRVIQTSAGVTANWWMVVGTSTQYIAGAFTTQTPIANVPNVYNVVDVNSGGDFFVTLGIPTLGGGQKFYINGYLNGVALTSGSAGFSSVAALLAFLNTGGGNTWENVGIWSTPEIPVGSGSYTTLTATQGSGHGANNGTDVLVVTLYVA